MNVSYYSVQFDDKLFSANSLQIKYHVFVTMSTENERGSAMKIKAGDKFSFLGYNCTVYEVTENLMTFFARAHGKTETKIVNVKSFYSAFDAGKIKLL